MTLKFFIKSRFATLPHARRIPVGILCRAIGGKSSITAANITQDQINSQYYIRKVVFTIVQTGSQKLSINLKETYLSMQQSELPM